MIRSVLQLTHRELHTLLRHRSTWVACIAAGTVLAMAGAFGTDEIMRFVPRALYWIGIVAFSYVTGAVAVNVVLGFWADETSKMWVPLTIGSLLAGCLITAEVLVFGIVLFGWVPDMSDALELWGQITAIAFVVTFTFAILDTSNGKDARPAMTKPALLDRLPFDKRGALVSLTALDHYVEVATTAGTEIVLIRLSDAIAETAPVRGLQIHRSHWVALDQVQSVARKDGRTEVILPGDRSLPVSRSNIGALKEVGLLPA